MSGPPSYNHDKKSGIVWMKRNNHFELTNSKLRSASSNLARGQSKMESEQNATTCKETSHPYSNLEEDGITSDLLNDDDSSDIPLNDDDVWDDSQLIKMYEASQKEINNELIKRFTLNDAGTSEPQKIDEPPKQTFDCKKVKAKVNQHKTIPKTTNVNNKSVLSKPLNWKENDYCQLTYSEDNVQYEAQIISIDNAEKTCMVRYIGYENEEIRSLCDLKPSEGENVRKLQIEMSIQDGYGKPLEEVDNAQTPQMAAASSLPSLLKNISQMNASTSRIIPPPPPFLNEPHNDVNNSQGANFEDEDDVLASMLMSWYMTGYHTGYYQARKDIKNNR